MRLIILLPYLVALFTLTSCAHKPLFPEPDMMAGLEKCAHDRWVDSDEVQDQIIAQKAYVLCLESLGEAEAMNQLTRH